jgi:hypothetical protein
MDFVADSNRCRNAATTFLVVESAQDPLQRERDTVLAFAYR